MSFSLIADHVPQMSSFHIQTSFPIFCILAVTFRNKESQRSRPLILPQVSNVLGLQIFPQPSVTRGQVRESRRLQRQKSNVLGIVDVKLALTHLMCNKSHLPVEIERRSLPNCRNCGIIKCLSMAS